MYLRREKNLPSPLIRIHDMHRIRSSGMCRFKSMFEKEIFSLFQKLIGNCGIGGEQRAFVQESGFCSLRVIYSYIFLYACVNSILVWSNFFRISFFL